MKALVLREYMQFSYEDVAEPEIQRDGVLVRVRACGICGSDVHGMDGSTGRRIPPIIMGHEAAGVIADLGADVNGFEVGDRVTFDSTVYCGSCFYCCRGQINLCDKRRVLGVSCEDYRWHGAFAEYVAVPQRILYRLPQGISFRQAAMVEPCSIAFHAVARTPVRLGDTAVVVGSGIIGLLVIQALRASGCGKVIAVDVDQHRLESANRLGADLVLNPARVDIGAVVRDQTDGRGADVAYEAVGITDSLNTAVASLRKGAALALIGNISPTVEYPQQAVVTRELSVYGCCASQGDYPACLDMIARGVINVEAILSAEAPLSEGASWFHRLYHKESGLMKVVLIP